MRNPFKFNKLVTKQKNETNAPWSRCKSLHFKLLLPPDLRSSDNCPLWKRCTANSLSQYRWAFCRFRMANEHRTILAYVSDSFMYVLLGNDRADSRSVMAHYTKIYVTAQYIAKDKYTTSYSFMEIKTSARLVRACISKVDFSGATRTAIDRLCSVSSSCNARLCGWWNASVKKSSAKCIRSPSGGIAVTIVRNHSLTSLYDDKIVYIFIIIVACHNLPDFFVGEHFLYLFNDRLFSIQNGWDGRKTKIFHFNFQRSKKAQKKKMIVRGRWRFENDFTFYFHHAY